MQHKRSPEKKEMFYHPNEVLRKWAGPGTGLGGGGIEEEEGRGRRAGEGDLWVWGLQGKASWWGDRAGPGAVRG